MFKTQSGLLNHAERMINTRLPQQPPK